MQSACPPVPRCVQAQTFLDSLQNRTRNSRDLSYGHPVGKDRNSDLDEKYQELAFMNGPQPSSRDRDQRGCRRDGRGGGASGMGDESSHISAESIQRLRMLRQQLQQPQQQQQQYQPQPQQRLQQHHDQRQTHRRLSSPLSCMEKLGDLGVEVTMMEKDSSLYGVLPSSQQPQELQIEKSPRKQRQSCTPRITIPPLQTQTQTQTRASVKTGLPSPPLTASTPESPSSLAIHLYVHHHHHHHGQQPESNVAVHTLLPSPSLPSPSSPRGQCLDDPMEEVKVSPPVVVSPRPLPILLPSLHIPEGRTSHATQPCSIKTPPTLSTESDMNSWYSHPHSRPSLTDTSNSSLSTVTLLEDLSKSCHPPAPAPPPPPRRRHRQQRPSSCQLLDPTMSAQILGTISSTDLGRMYVHAAHHLHSHQPIRRYVLMKQIMTQAELIQYGRLRADMPRAPGPSTGALPRRTGFGTEANKGNQARPKVSSNLVMCRVLTAERDEDNEDVKDWKDKELGVTVEERKRKLIKVPWTRSLPSLASLSTTLTLKRTKTLRPGQEKQQTRPHSWYGGMLGDNNDLLREEEEGQEKEEERDSEDDIEAAAGVGIGSLSSLFKDRKPRRSSCSEPDLYSVRRLEELEMGTIRAGDEDDEMGEASRKDRVEEEAEEMMDYWTMIRNRNNPSRRRQIRATHLEHLQGSTATTTSTVYSSQLPHLLQEFLPYPPQHLQQQQLKQLKQQQQQQGEMDQICLEPYSAQIPMQQSHPLSSLPFPFPQSQQLPYNQAIQEHQYHPQQPPPQLSKGHLTNNYSTSSSISKSKGSNTVKKWSSKRRNSQSNLSLLPSSTHGGSLSLSSTSTTSSSTLSSSPSSSSSLPLLSLLPESQAVSGMVMLSLLFGGVYLVHGTNHLYNLQSAFLSIIV